MNLRDHDAPCEHGRFLTHVVIGARSVQLGDIECPGGAAVVIDYEAVATSLCTGRNEHPNESFCASGVWLAHEVVDAALGLTDD